MRARRFIPLAFGMAAILSIAAFGVASAGGRPLSTSLSAAEEISPARVPDNGEPGATGEAHVTFNPGQGEVCFDVTVTGTTNILAAHIHHAAAGVNGPIVINFITSPLPDGQRHFEGCSQASRELILELFHDQSDYYVNVHTTAKPGGAVRGQLGD